MSETRHEWRVLGISCDECIHCGKRGYASDYAIDAEPCPARTTDPRDAALNKAREALEQLAAQRDFKGFKYPIYGPDVQRIAAEALAEIEKVITSTP